jgi:hypothetical protein
MGKAGPLRKSGEKSARKPVATGKPTSKAKRPAEHAARVSASKGNGASNGAAKAEGATRKSTVAVPRQVTIGQPEVAVPETPPPLPSPIASFTF